MKPAVLPRCWFCRCWAVGGIHRRIERPPGPLALHCGDFRQTRGDRRFRQSKAARRQQRPVAGRRCPQPRRWPGAERDPIATVRSCTARRATRPATCTRRAKGHGRPARRAERSCRGNAHARCRRYCPSSRQQPAGKSLVDGQPPSAASNGGGLQPAQGAADPRHLRAGFRGRRVDLEPRWRRQAVASPVEPLESRPHSPARPASMPHLVIEATANLRLETSPRRTAEQANAALFASGIWRGGHQVALRHSEAYRRGTAAGRARLPA